VAIEVDWSAKTDSQLPIDFSQVDYSKFFNNSYINIFMMINVVLGLVLLDRYLSLKKRSFQNKPDNSLFTGLPVKDRYGSPLFCRRLFISILINNLPDVVNK